MHRTNNHDVFAPLETRPFVSRPRARYNQPFAYEALIKLRTPLPSRLLKNKYSSQNWARFASPLLSAVVQPIGLPAAIAGGAGRDRTDDLLLAKQALSQLSYSPDTLRNAALARGGRLVLVGLDGFEPSTPALSRRCSNQLSYRPVVSRVALGVQPIGCGYSQWSWGWQSGRQWPLPTSVT